MQFHVTILFASLVLVSGCSKVCVTPHSSASMHEADEARRRRTGAEMCHDGCELGKAGPLHDLPRPYPPTPRPPGQEAKPKSKETSAVGYDLATRWAKDRIFIRALLQEFLSDGVLTDDEYDRIRKVHDEEDLAKAKVAAFDLLNSEISVAEDQ